MTVDLDSSDDALPGAVARRALADQYATLIIGSRHPREIEAAIEVACNRYRALNDAYVQYLSSKRGRRGYRNQSPKWREAEAAAFASAETLAAILGARYANPNGQIPIRQAQELIARRVGPLCNGWTDGDANTLTHNPEDPCPVHG